MTKCQKDIKIKPSIKHVSLTFQGLLTFSPEECSFIKEIWVKYVGENYSFSKRSQQSDISTWGCRSSLLFRTTNCRCQSSVFRFVLFPDFLFFWPIPYFRRVRDRSGEKRSWTFRRCWPGKAHSVSSAPVWSWKTK